MQDRYAGDIGDYVKLALLRALSVDLRLGVVWYRTLDKSHNGDGKHTAYLQDPPTWQAFDPPLYQRLRALHATGLRSVAALEDGFIDGDVRYFDAPLERPAQRPAWISAADAAMRGRNLIFLDPDNGIAPRGFADGGRQSIKSATLAEIRHFAFPPRPVVIYHHQTRFKGGHLKEIEDLGARLRSVQTGCVCALRAAMYSPRCFFIVGATQELWARAQSFAVRWAPHVSFHAISGPPDRLNLPPDHPYSEVREMALEKCHDRVIRDEYPEMWAQMLANGYQPLIDD